MKGSFFRIDITPPIGLPIGGNVRADDKARGIHDPLYCSVAFLSEGANQIGIMSLDLLALDYTQCQQLKKVVSEAAGIPKDHILVSCTHTHSGPNVIGMFQEKIDPGCLDYLKEINSKISGECARHAGDLESVTMLAGKRNVPGISYDRRIRQAGGSVRMNWEQPDENPAPRVYDPIDDDLITLAFVNERGERKGVVANFALHPAVLVGKDWLWSRDFIHYTDNWIRNAFDNETVLIYLNGAEGNINHIKYGDIQQGRGFEEASRIGNTIGASIADSVSHARSICVASIECIASIVSFPLRRIFDSELIRAKSVLAAAHSIPSLLDGVPDEICAREILELSKSSEDHIETELQVVRLGNVLLVTFPGEVFFQIGSKIKSMNKKYLVVIAGLANDYVGYIPTHKAFSEGGYEIQTVKTSKLDTNADRLLIQYVNDLIKQIS